MIEHHAVVNRILWMQAAYALTASDVLLQKTPVVFDVSVWELFWWSVTGASLCILPPGAEGDPRSIIATVERHSVTVMHFVPSMLGTFLSVLQVGDDVRLRSLRRVFSSGEALKPEHVNRFRNGIFQYNNTELINLYGPTEATVDVSYYRCNVESGETVVPIGKPISNTQLYILDPSLKLCPVGVRGELCISGVGLSRGYLSNEKLTAEKFVAHPYIKGGKLYRTGDLAYWQEDGNIVYLGRIDNQVKLRGYRIELGEVENRLGSHAQVSEAVVVVQEDGEDKFLVGYYVSAYDIPVAELRMHLSTTLPDYMIPGYFIRLDQMPLTVSGKADRRKLPPPRMESEESLITPSNEIEETLTEIWSKILKLERTQIGTNINFFSIGGYSLNAISAIYLIYEELNYEMSLMEFFNNPTIKQMAECIGKNAVIDITI
jgi:acyl-coenzyme A synthetase/AMP-(fatty) acid ligase